MKEREVTQEVGAQLRQLREACGLSQMALAHKLGISYQQVQKYEKGASALNVSRLIQIAEIFGVPTIALTGEARDAATVNDALHARVQNREERDLLKLFRELGTRTLRRSAVDVLRSMNGARKQGGRR